MPEGIEPPAEYASKAKYCKKCKGAWKPERAHHCRACNACVFKVSDIL